MICRPLNSRRGTDDARRRKEQWRDPEGRETGTVEEDDDDDDADEVVNQTQTGTESVIRRDVPDAMQRARAFGNQIAEQQAHREKVMADAYAAYDRDLMEQSRK